MVNYGEFNDQSVSGNDLENGVSNQISKQECVDKCDQTDDCLVANYLPTYGLCYLKSFAGTNNDKVKITSGTDILWKMPS
jgi:hypothetical protein